MSIAGEIFQDKIEELKEENRRLRELVERGSNILFASCSGAQTFAADCRDEMEKWK